MSVSNDGPPPATAPQPWNLLRLLRLWFGVKQPVSPRAYALSGFGLMLFKYAAEALVIFLCTSSFLSPLDFLNPTMHSREVILRPPYEWLGWVLFLWTLPFLWIAVSMSIRRMINAGSSPWVGLLVLVPVVNSLAMLAMCIPPSRQTMPASLDNRSAPSPDRAKYAAFAIGISILVGGCMLWLSVYLFSIYGASLFIGTPMLMGTVASYLYYRKQRGTYLGAMGLGLASVFFAMCTLMLFALEGAICIAMAAPLVLPIGAMGGLIGKAIADATQQPDRGMMAALLVLPIITWAESHWQHSPESVVLSTLEINAPPETVWNHVIDFPDLTEPRDWYFNWGIACPLRARITGTGVGATRYCEFTTGTFVEPITAWNQPERLSFDVAEQPDPMFELSPYRNIHPPHLNHYLRSTHGEFRLVALPNGHTQLEGRTWYKFDMFPQAYWTLWSDLFIHRIHERVLEHIKSLSEQTTTGD